MRSIMYLNWILFTFHHPGLQSHLEAVTNEQFPSRMGCVIHNIWDTRIKSSLRASFHKTSLLRSTMKEQKLPGELDIRARKLGYRIYRRAAKIVPQMSFEPLKRKEFSTQCWFFRHNSKKFGKTTYRCHSNYDKMNLEIRHDSQRESTNHYP